MAHELDIRNGKASIAYVGERPWHGLGQELQEGLSMEDWKEAAGMDWSIRETVVEYNDGDALVPFDSQKVLFRSDSREPLAIVSQDYKVVQPGEVLEFFRDLVAMQGMKLTTAGVLFGGRRFWALADTGRAAEVLGKDHIKGMLLLTTSCDGTLATTAQFTSVRVVCNNTLSISLAEDVKDRARVTHRTTFDPKVIKDRLGLLDASWENFKDKISMLSKQKVDDKKAREFIRSLFVNPNRDEASQPYTVEKNTNIVMNRYNDGMGTNMAHGTLWGVMNSITEYVDHDSRARTPDTALWESWNGKGANLKQKAFDKIMELV